MRRFRNVLLGVSVVLLVLTAPLACVRWEQWQFHNAAGQMVMSTGGYRLIGMGPPRTEPGTQITSIKGWGEGWFGLFRFSVDRAYEGR
jgi:hypothetical protein